MKKTIEFIVEWMLFLMIYSHFCSLKLPLNFLQGTANKPDFQENIRSSPAVFPGETILSGSNGQVCRARPRSHLNKNNLNTGSHLMLLLSGLRFCRTDRWDLIIYPTHADPCTCWCRKSQIQSTFMGSSTTRPLASIFIKHETYSLKRTN